MGHIQFPSDAGNTGVKIETVQSPTDATLDREIVDARIVGDTVVTGLETADNTSVITQNTKTIAAGTTPLTPKFAKIDRGAAGDGAAVVNLVAAKKIRVLRYRFLCAGAVGVKWQSSTANGNAAGVNTDLGPVESYAANGGVVENFCPLGIMETVAGEALKLNLNGAQQVSGNLTYIEVP